MLDLSEENVTDQKVAEFSQAVYKQAGLREGTEMTFSDFSSVFGSGDYAQTLKKATLELDGVNGTTYIPFFNFSQSLLPK